MQFYSGNFLDGSQSSGGEAFNQHGAICLEAQHFPDAVNQAAFPSVDFKAWSNLPPNNRAYVQRVTLID